MENFVSNLRVRLNFDQATGEFRWNRSNRGGYTADAVAGCIAPNGHRYIRFLGTLYLASRLAWVYVYGRWPSEEIDHINCNTLDNRLINLREAARGENCRNIRKPNHNKSGYKGVSWDNRRQKWLAQIAKDNRNYYLGHFDDREIAYSAYCGASKSLHGEFGRVD